MICGVVATSIEACDVCTACCVECDDVTHNTARSTQPEILVATTPHII
jgi:hypothetical protein